MARPKNEFRSLDQIADFASKLDILAKSAAALAASLRLLEATGAEMAAPKGAEDSLETIANWLQSGYLRIAEFSKNRKGLGIPMPDGVVTGYNRTPPEAAGNKGKKVKEKGGNHRAAK